MAQTEASEETEYDLTVSDVSKMTPFTAKYITNQAKSGKLSHRRWGEGKKARYLFNEDEVLEWKRRMLINPDKTKISSSVARSGMPARKGKGVTSRNRSKQLIKQSLASASSNS